MTNSILIRFTILLSAIILYSCDASKTMDVETNVCDDPLIPSDLNFNDVEQLQLESNYSSMVGDSGLVCRYYIPNMCGLDTIPKKTHLNLNGIAGYSEFANVVVGDSGLILVDFDSLINIGEMQRFNDVVTCWDPYSYIIAGDSGKIYKSSDGGYTWYSVFSGTDLNILSLEKGINFNKINATGADGVYLRSTDDGESWSISSITEEGLSGIYPDIYSIYFLDQNYGWASGESGKIYKTIDGGNIWHSQVTGLSENINDILFNSYSYGYAVADNGKVIYTTTGGEVWLSHPLFDTLTTKNLKKIVKADSVNYFAVGDSAVIININTGIAAGPLTGTITAGNAGDFTTINNALLAASSLGIKDSLKIEIMPGTYDEQLVVTRPYPEDAQLTLSGENDSVYITKSPADTSNFTLKFSSAKKIVIENLIISNPDTTKGRVVLFEGDCSDITFRNVTFNGVSVTSSTVNQSLVMNDAQPGSKLNDVKFENCTFNYGSFALRLYGTSSSNYISGLEVSNCNINKCSQSAFGLNNNENFLVNGNTIDSAALGIALSNSRNFAVTGNRINTLNVSMSIEQLHGDRRNRNLIANNFIHSNAIALYLAVANSNNDIYFNSFNIQDPSDTSSLSGTSCISTFFFSGSNNNIIDNLFINKRKGPAVTISYSGANPFTSVNYNDYYTAGSLFATWQGVSYPDFNSFRTGSGRDTNSVSQNVTYAGPSDLHLSGASNGDTLLKGKPLAVVTTDIDGFARSIVSPYKGADEGTIPFDHKILNLKINFEALQISDTIVVQLRNVSSPYNLIESKAGLGGLGMFRQINFSSAVNGTQYYVDVRHRNSIETWSGGSLSFSNDSLAYDFTTSSSQAYGSNMVQVSGLWSFFAADVNQDGNVGGLDLSLVDNDAFNFVSGYVNTDVNGDNVTNALDLGITDNNAFNFVSKITPP